MDVYLSKILVHALFGPEDILAYGCFNMGMFQHEEFSGTGNFRYEESSAQEHFGTGTFQHMDVLADCKSIWTFWHRDFSTCATVPRCPCAEKSLCRNVLGPKITYAKNSSCQKVPMSKCSPVEKSICWNVRSDKWCTCQNVS